MLKRGQDPRRVLGRHRERGPKVIGYTYEEVADFLGMTGGALRVAITRGQVDPQSLESIMEYYLYRHDKAVLSERKGRLRGLVQEARALTGLDDE